MKKIIIGITAVTLLAGAGLFANSLTKKSNANTSCSANCKCTCDCSKGECPAGGSCCTK